MGFLWKLDRRRQTKNQLDSENEDGLVVPRLLTAEVNSMENVLDEGAHNRAGQDGELKPKQNHE